VLFKKIKKKNITKFKDVIESYWSDVGKFQGIKGMNYDNFKFINTRNLFKLSLEYPHLSLGFNCILKLRAGYKIQNIIQLLQLEVVEFLTTVLNSALVVEKVNNHFIHWIFECSIFSLCRCKSLDFIDDLFIIFANKVRNLSLLPSYSNILEYENFINRYIYTFLLGGISALDELQFDTGEQRHLSEQLLKSSQGSTVPYIVGLPEYLANTIPIISSSLELLFERFSKNNIHYQECRRRTDMAKE